MKIYGNIGHVTKNSFSPFAIKKIAIFLRRPKTYGSSFMSVDEAYTEGARMPFT